MLKLSLTFCSDKIHQGGGVAAPVGGKILNEVLPYLEVQKEQVEEDIQEIEVPNLVRIINKRCKGNSKRTWTRN